MSNKKIPSTESVSTVDQIHRYSTVLLLHLLNRHLYLVGFTLAQICYRRN